MANILNQIQWADPAKYIARANFAQAFAQGQAAAQQERAIKQQAKLRQREQELDARRLGLQEGKLDIEAMRASGEVDERAAKERQMKELLGSRAMHQSVQQLEKMAQNPQMYQQAYPVMAERMRMVLSDIDPAMAEDVPDYIPPDQISALGQGLRERISRATDMKQFLGEERMAASLLQAEQAPNDPTLANPDFARTHPMWRKYLAKANAQASKRGSVSVPVTIQNQMPTQKTVNEIQGDIRGARRELRDMADLANVIGDDWEDLFGWVPRGERFALGTMAKAAPSWMSEEQKQRYSRLYDVRDILGKMNLRDVHKYFGGALTSSEITRLRDRLLSEDVDPVVAQTGLERLWDVYMTTIEEGQRMLQEDAFSAASKEQFQEELARRIKALGYRGRAGDGLRRDDNPFRTGSVGERAGSAARSDPDYAASLQRALDEAVEE